MHKRAELESSVLVYTLAIVAIGFMLIFSFGGIKSIKQTEKKFEINSFVDTLQNSIKSQATKSFGSVNSISISLPSEIDTVCFVDDKERFSPERFSGLNTEKQIYQDKNVFFFPVGNYDPSKVTSIKLNDSENPLCVKTVNGRLNLKLTTSKNTTLVEAANEKEAKKSCVIVSGSDAGNPDDKVDIVFLQYGYNNQTGFGEAVSDYVQNYFFKTEPFSRNKAKFNVWMVDDGQPNCSITSYVYCDSFSMNTLASNCPNDYVIVLVNPKLLRTSVRSSAISNAAKINTKDNQLVVLHEFAHIFADLADEYTDSYYESWFDSKDYPNCDNPGCSKWSSVENTSCIKGCSTNKFYRSVDVSIMKDYDKSSSYGKLNEDVINKALGEYR